MKFVPLIFQVGLHGISFIYTASNKIHSYRHWVFKQNHRQKQRMPRRLVAKSLWVSVQRSRTDPSTMTLSLHKSRPCPFWPIFYAAMQPCCDHFKAKSQMSCCDYCENVHPNPLAHEKNCWWRLDTFFLLISVLRLYQKSICCWMKRCWLVPVWHRMIPWGKIGMVGTREYTHRLTMPSKTFGLQYACRPCSPHSIRTHTQPTVPHRLHLLSQPARRHPGTQHTNHVWQTAAQPDRLYYKDSQQKGRPRFIDAHLGRLCQ